MAPSHRLTIGYGGSESAAPCFQSGVTDHYEDPGFRAVGEEVTVTVVIAGNVNLETIPVFWSGPAFRWFSSSNGKLKMIAHFRVEHRWILDQRIGAGPEQGIRRGRRGVEAEQVVGFAG